MATSEFWQRLSATMASSHEWEGGVAGAPPRGVRGTAKLWMVMDVISIAGAATLATIYKSHAVEGDVVWGLWDGRLLHGRSVWTLVALLCGFAIALMITSKRLHLYSPTRLTGILHEQRLSMQACFTSGLLLTGALYVLRADDIPRSIILITVGLVAISLGLRRLVRRVLLFSRYTTSLRLSPAAASKARASDSAFSLRSVSCCLSSSCARLITACNSPSLKPSNVSS